MKLRPTPYILLADTKGPNTAGSPAPSATSNAIIGNNSDAGSPHKQRRNVPLAYLSYLRHMQKNQKSLLPVEKFGAGYQDYLQAPLQPLTDNLESITYEVFEKDPVKYDQYEKAIKLALEERDPNKTMYAPLNAPGGTGVLTQPP